MAHKKYILASLLAAFALYGCSDDSSGSSSGGTTPDACENNSDCNSGKCLDSGICAELVGEGDACDDAHVCRDELECQDAVCTIPDEDSLNKECIDSEECPDGKSCIDSKCIRVSFADEGESCNDGSVQCKGDLFCVDEICTAQIPDAGACKSDAHCANEEIYKDCLSDGYCGLYLERGQECWSDNRFQCKDGMECYGVCTKEVGEGEFCDENDYIECDISSFCIDNICRTPRYNVQKGESCNNDWLLCTTGLTCLNGKCLQLQNEDEACNEAEFMACKGGLECINDICTPLGDECKSTSDCTEKDMFCCLDSECGAPNRCIPYDDERNTHDEACIYKTKPGIFEAQIQCRWQPPADDKNAASSKVEMHPLVGHFGNKAGLGTVVAFWSYAPTVIRFINPETCETLESIPVGLDVRWHNYPSAADVDKDGLLELFVIKSDGKPIMYKWNKETQKHEAKWIGKLATGDHPFVFDINNDGDPEIVLGSSVINAKTGATIFAHKKSDGTLMTYQYQTAAIGYLDGNQDGNAWLVISKYVYRWNSEKNNWDIMAELDANVPHLAYADFGTVGATAADFDFDKLDGLPEIVTSGSGKLRVYALKKVEGGKRPYEAQKLREIAYSTPILSSTTTPVGGPITIGDFDSDGLPEIGVASSGFFGVYDMRCKEYEDGKCAGPNVLWERWSQDGSSGTTGSSLFDFDGDGQTEAVYADECFTRVYDGKTGKVLFSSKRSSSTSIEGPVIADIDGDGSAEILMGSDANHSCYDDSRAYVNPSQPGKSNCVDPIHEGIRCQDDEDCPMSKNCDKTLGLCLCESDNDCNTQYVTGKDGKKKILQQYVCAPPIHPNVGMMLDTANKGTRKLAKAVGTRPDGWDKTTGYKVCRATRLTKDIGVGDLMIFKDRLDRWVSSRNIWNQHAYNIINIEDNGRVPSRSQWITNWAAKMVGINIENSTQERPRYNNYRLNKQGDYGAGTVPDITGRFIAGSICGTTDDGRHVISGKLCNRGTKPVSTKLPATFFYYDEEKPDHRGETLCTSYTKSIVGVGECAQVGCEVSKETLNSLAGKKLLMVTNLDENGLASTVECNSDNNTDSIVVETCQTNDIEIIN